MRLYQTWGSNVINMPRVCLAQGQFDKFLKFLKKSPFNHVPESSNNCNYR